MKSINKRDAEIKKELEKEYGSIDINVEDGTYTLIEEKIKENV